MSAIPAISAGVSLIGTVAGIRQQSQAANAQANALDDQRTNAFIQADIAAAEQKQQFLIAKTQQNIEAKQTAANFELAKDQAQLQRAQYDVQVEEQRLALATSRLALEEQSNTNAANIQQQSLTAQSNLLGNKAQTDNAIAQAQEQVSSQSADELTALQQLSLASRQNRFFGDTGKQQQANIAANNNAVSANLDQLGIDSEANARNTEAGLVATSALEAAALEVNNTNTALGNTALDNSQATLDQNVGTADRTLSEFQTALQLAISNNADSATLNALLLEETNKAQQRTQELGLSASVTSINNQASQIQRPGFSDVLNAGLGVFNVFNTLTEQQKQLAATQAQTKANNATRNNVVQETNPYYGQPVSGTYDGTGGVAVGLDQPSFLSEANRLVNFQQAQDSRVNNAVVQNGVVEFVNPYAPKATTPKPIKPMIRKTQPTTKKKK
jgi:hypothetical protein